jgi:hypothetical protein
MVLRQCFANTAEVLGCVGRTKSMLRSRTLGALVVGFSVVAPSVAGADAAADVSEIRTGTLPVRHDWLGWDAAGHSHVRELVCSTGGTNSCHARLVDSAPDGTTRVTKLLDVVEVYCGTQGTCSALDAKTVADFEAAEKRALLGLPPLTKTAPAPNPTTVLGTVAGEPTRIEVAAFDASTSSEDRPHVAVRVVARGKGGAFEVLTTIDERVFSLDRASLDAAYLSPDGKSAALIATADTTVMCWSFQALRTTLVDLARHRASLANTIGFRAWKKGDMPAALAAFAEATQHDPAFALGWYNRAAVESRTGATGSGGHLLPQGRRPGREALVARVQRPRLRCAPRTRAGHYALPTYSPMRG